MPWNDVKRVFRYAPCIFGISSVLSILLVHLVDPSHLSPDYAPTKIRKHYRLTTVTSPAHDCPAHTRRVTKKILGATARWCEKKLVNIWVKHGEIRYFDLAGHLKLRGYYLSGHPELSWTGFDERGKVVSRSFFKHGKLEGEVENYHENGSEAYRANFQNGILNGRQTWWFNNGQMKETGEVISGKTRGINLVWFPNGTLRERHEYLNEKGDVFQTLWWESGAKSGEGLRLADGLPTLWKKWHANGQLRFEGYMSHDKAHGAGVTWRENGMKESEGDFREGILSSYTLWDEHGYKEEDNLTKDGRLVREIFYKLGKKALEVEFDVAKNNSKTLTVWDERGEFGIKWSCGGNKLRTLPAIIDIIDGDRHSIFARPIQIMRSAYEFMNTVCENGHYGVVRRYIRNPLGFVSAVVKTYPAFVIDIKVSSGPRTTRNDIACLTP